MSCNSFKSSFQYPLTERLGVVGNTTLQEGSICGSLNTDMRVLLRASYGENAFQFYFFRSLTAHIPTEKFPLNNVHHFPIQKYRDLRTTEDPLKCKAK